MKGTELVAFAILAVLAVLWMAWPRSSRSGGRRVRPRRPEGPPHPYRRAATQPQRRVDDAGETEGSLAWSEPEPELIPSRVVEIAGRTGRRWEAIAFLEAEVAARPDPDLAYLLARTLAEHGDLAAAEHWLKKAADLGQRDLERARKEPAFEPLRARPSWPEVEAALGGDDPAPRG